MRDPAMGIFAIPHNFIDKDLATLIPFGKSEEYTGRINKEKTIMVGTVAFTSYGSYKAFRHGVVAIDKRLLDPTNPSSIKKFISISKDKFSLSAAGKEKADALASVDEIVKVSSEWRKQNSLATKELPILIKECDAEFEETKAAIEK